MTRIGLLEIENRGASEPCLCYLWGLFSWNCYILLEFVKSLILSCCQNVDMHSWLFQSSLEACCCPIQDFWWKCTSRSMWEKLSEPSVAWWVWSPKGVTDRASGKHFERSFERRISCVLEGEGVWLKSSFILRGNLRNGNIQPYSCDFETWHPFFGNGSKGCIFGWMVISYFYSIDDDYNGHLWVCLTSAESNSHEQSWRRCQHWFTGANTRCFITMIYFCHCNN